MDVRLPGPTKSGQPKATLWGSPTVVGGRVYIGSGTGRFYALNAATGKIVWQRLLDYGIPLHCAARGIASTATVATDPVSGKLTVYIAGAHFLYALDAATGAVKWKNSVGPWGGQASGMYYNWSSPTVASGRIFMGISSDCEDFHVRAGALAYSQHTGALQHAYYDMPAGSVGGSIWSTPASDGTSVWVTTGDPAASSPQVGDSYSIVRLSAATMVKQDSWRTTDTAVDDFDFGSSPTLFPATVGGNGVAGALRAVDPDTGDSLWEQPLDCVPLGSPTINGTTGIVAVPTYSCPSGKTPSVQLFSEATGEHLATLPASSPVFSQPVFAEGLIFVGSGGTSVSGGGKLTAYGP